MHSTMRAALGLLVFAALCACQRMEPAAARINQVVALSPAATSALEAFQADAAGHAQAPTALHEQLQDRLTVRALECAQGFKPRWWHDDEHIRSALGDADCFARADTSLAHWIGLRHAGLLLSAPPLRPLPAQPASELVAQARISEVSFARLAGVAVLHTVQQHELIDMADGQPMAQLPRGERDLIHDISDNGRLLSLRRDGQTLLLDLQQGRALVTFDHRDQVFFVGQAGIIVHGQRDTPLVLHDLTQGRQQRLPVNLDNLQRVSATAQPDHWALLGNSRHALITLRQQDTGWHAQVVREQESSHHIGQWPRGNLSADGRHYLGLQNGPAWLDLQTLSVTRPSLVPLRISRATPTADDGASYLFAHSMTASGLQSFALHYRHAEHSVAEIQISKRLSSTLQWIAPLARNALVDGFKLTLMSDLELRQPAMPLPRFLSALPPPLVPDADPLATNGAQMLLRIAQQQAMARRNAAPAPALDPALGALAQHAQIEAVGVYEAVDGRHGHGMERKAGTVQVMVKAGKPVILVLSAYEPVNWVIQPEAGARVLAVLHGGYHQGQVYGADDSRHHHLGRMYTHRRDSSQFSQLDTHVRQLTGKGIDRFQGTYSGSHFRVGQ